MNQQESKNPGVQFQARSQAPRKNQNAMQDDHSEETKTFDILMKNTKSLPVIQQKEFQTEISKDCKKILDLYVNKFKKNHLELQKLRKTMIDLKNQSDSEDILKRMVMPKLRCHKLTDEDSKSKNQESWNEAILTFKKTALSIILKDKKDAHTTLLKVTEDIEEELRVKLCHFNASITTFNITFLTRGIQEAMTVFLQRTSNFLYSLQLKEEISKTKAKEILRRKEEAKAAALEDPELALKTQIKEMMEAFYNKKKQKSQKSNKQPKKTTKKKIQNSKIATNKTILKKKILTKLHCNHCKKECNSKKQLLEHVKSKHAKKHPNMLTTKTSRSKTGKKNKEKKNNKSKKKQ